MNLKYLTTTLRRRSLMLMVVVALFAAMLPTAAFASGYGRQGRAYDPGPRPQQSHQRHGNQNRHGHNDHRPNRCDASYRVKRGDSLSEIAAHYGVSVRALQKANGIKNPNRIYAGQVICIPC